MAEVLSPADFLNVLPSSGNTAFFLPYIERCHRRQQAEQLKETIIAKALALEKTH